MRPFAAQFGGLMTETSSASPRSWAVWHVLGLVVVLTAPSLIWLREPFWRHPLELASQAPVLALAYGMANWTAYAVARSRVRRVLAGVSTLAITVALGFLLQVVRLTAPYSKPIGAISVALGFALIVLGEFLQGWLRAVSLFPYPYRNGDDGHRTDRRMAGTCQADNRQHNVPALRLLPSKSGITMTLWPSRIFSKAAGSRERESVSLL